MKTIYLMIGAAIAAAALASCEKTEKEAQAVETAKGFYILNQGNQASKIPSSVTAYDYATGTATNSMADAFAAANGIELGDDATAMYQYGSKLYIAAYSSDIIWAVNPVSLRIIGHIQPSTQMQGHNPRHMTGHDGKLYASMFTGYVAEIDTTALTITRELATGPNPEGVAVAGGKLYVANSDGMNWMASCANSSVSVVDLKTWTQTRISDLSKLMNPTTLLASGDRVFVLCMGEYGVTPAAVKCIKGTQVTEVAPATMMTLADNTLYLIDSPFGAANPPTFLKYDATTLQCLGEIAQRTQGTDSWIDYATGIGVNPLNGDIVILSDIVDPATGWAQFYEPGYANIYNSKGEFQKRIATGVGPLAVQFLNVEE